MQILDQYWDLAAELSWLHSGVLVGHSDRINGGRQCDGNDRCFFWSGLRRSESTSNENALSDKIIIC